MYTPMVKETKRDETAEKVYPKVGDVVRYDGKWRGEHQLGQIRSLQKRLGTTQWTADVQPMKETKADNVYRVDRNAKLFFEDVQTLSPVRASYVRSENGYKVMTRVNSTEPILRAPFYDMDETFTLPVRVIDEVKQSEYLTEYFDLKERLVKNSLLFGAAGTAVSVGVGGVDSAVAYVSGALAGTYYLYLLGKKADTIGAVSLSPRARLQTLVANGRLLLPVVAVGIIATKDYILTGVQPEMFTAISRDEFLLCVLGFLTHRLSIFVNEVAPVKKQDLLSMVPGSVGVGMRIMQASKGEVKPQQQYVTLAVVSGPELAGRSQLVEAFIQQNREFRLPVYPTPDADLAATNPSRFKYCEPNEWEELIRNPAFITTGSLNGRPVALMEDLLKEPSINGQVCLLELDPSSLSDLIERGGGFALGTAWVTLKDIDAFKRMAKESYIKSASEMDEEAYIRTSVSAAMRDLEYGFSSKAIEFTIFNADPSQALSELKSALQYTLTLSPNPNPNPNPTPPQTQNTKA